MSDSNTWKYKDKRKFSLSNKIVSFILYSPSPCW
jgi:hypothetical protein